MASLVVDWLPVILVLVIGIALLVLLAESLVRLFTRITERRKVERPRLLSRSSLVTGGVALIVVLVLGAVALPSYQDYSIRARLAGVMPVYNALLSPQLPRSGDAPNRPVLRPGVPAELRFGIGPRWANSDLPPIAPNERILQSETDLALTAVLACSFCETHGAYMRDLTYQPRVRRSNDVTFQLVPKIQPKGLAYPGTLEIAIFDDSTGRQYDRLTIDVWIGDAPAGVEAEGQEPVVLETFSPSTNRTPVTDVTLHINEDMGRGVTIKVVPVQPALRASLGERVQTSGGGARIFRTGVMNERSLQKLTTGAFTRISQLSLQGELADSLREPGGTLVSESATKTLQLSPREAARVSATIARFGQTLYRALFVDGEDGDALAEIIAVIEAQAAKSPPERPLRMQVVTDGLSLPWQYLHPVGQEVDALGFWGMRFSLSVQRANNHNAMSSQGNEAAASARKVVFARHGSVTDETTKYAQQQIQKLKELPVNDLLVVESAPDFLQRALRDEREHISAIIAFLHASSSRSLQATGGSIVALEDAEGPLLYFGDKDAVTTAALEELMNKVSVTERRKRSRYLAGGPLVILNACETGPSTIAVPYVTLEDAMFDLGAQGIVATEVAVWVALGHEVGTRLVDKLGRGQTASDALTTIRRELVLEKQNPLGVLYAYYGDPAAVLRR